MRVVGIEIGAREVRIAWAERRVGTARPIALERRAAPGPEAVDDALAAVARRRPDVVLTVLPATCAAHRVLQLPFRQRRRIARTAPLELLGQLPVDGRELVVAWEPIETTSAGSVVLAAAVRRADVDAHLARLVAAGLRVTRLELAPLPAWNLLAVADGNVALLVADGAASTLSIRRRGRLAMLRSLGSSATDPARLAAEVRWSLAAAGGVARIVVAGADADDALRDVVATATGVEVVPFADAALPSVRAEPADLAACAVAAGLVSATRGAPGGLTVAGTRHGGPRSFRRAAVLAAVALGLAGLDAALVHRQLARRDAALVRAIAEEAAAALPGTPLLAPGAQLEAAAAAALRRDVRFGAQSSTLELLRELTGRVPASVRLDLDELAIDADTVTLHGRTDGFEAVDALRRALAASPALGDVAADDTHASVDGRRVEFRLRATRRAGGGATS